ncbi:MULTISPECIES: helix-turn-helix transcriptional regulator [unclassified Microbacterium]|jgi:transcriptional regulator with XRE-family HTH domain|uniref:helix-turn-helix transcriptional regulator n=1 Tax=unclassified Microbacterium TaxID=2609290 RepID=UPI000411EA0A|nr:MULTISPECIES: helix-turn-helix transcriptional regulator [unclassified Microbacterium]PQZ57471.1 XRE family transcriptional regulator [Microbacterium sp. MYb43]PQZ77319.1 XRE family transcriptional regulator [Microbacterium sp. MYb40]PRB22732.1 XRE family transcriptional regulator [Microbacterium sp. MYb54]PRB28926.1 XRE family transcriptional regulator [Microbacterium sp. MYb50]PRB68998.1 XRE family transcriptional regulator [Microbacterium sp. MYb24]
MASSGIHLTTLGHRIRHHRLENGFTLDELGALVGVAGSQLSLIENGKREPKLSLLQAIAHATSTEVTDLISGEPPNRRAALEIALERAQESPVFRQLGVAPVRVTKGMSDETIESVLGLHRELERREREAIATPEEARRANTELRLRMRAQNNYLPEIEKLAEKHLKAAGHVQGALTHRTVSIMAEKLGFELIYVNDLPHSTRSVTDLENGRIYLPPASIPGGHGLRSMALQAMAHRYLGHRPPTDYADFLQQRLEINYFAACCLMPETAAVAFLQQAKKDRNLAVEDFRDAFGVTHEGAGMRMTNLLTQHLGMSLHFLRVDSTGAITRVYENDDLPLPMDVTGAVEGQRVCRKFQARAAFTQQNRTTEHHQYTDTPSGTFWCSTQTGSSSDGEFSVTVGVPFDDARWWRGRETNDRAVSTCPDESCCRRPSEELTERWNGRAWPSARVHTHMFSPLPRGAFPGVDDNEVYNFLGRHASE